MVKEGSPLPLRSSGWYSYLLLARLWAKKTSKSTYDTRPTTVVASRLSLQVGSLFIIENPSETISHARWYYSNTLKRTMPLYRIDNVLSWGSPQGLLVRVLNRRERAVLGIPVPSDTGGIVGALMVVPTKACFVKTIDDVGALKVLFPKMVSTVRSLGLFANRVQGRGPSVVQRCSTAPFGDVFRLWPSR